MSRLVLGALVFLVACSMPALPFAPPSPTPTKPQVTILAPPNNTTFALGTDVIVQSSATDARGILRIDLLVDGQVVRSDLVPSGTSQPQFQIAQPWKASVSGTRAIIVRATNQDGAKAETALIITISEPPKPTNTPVFPTFTPAPISGTPIPAPKAPAATSAPKAPTPTITSSRSQQQTLTLTEAQVNAIINTALASGQIKDVSNASVSLQNNQITLTAKYTPPGLVPLNAKLVLTARANNCTLAVTVVQATLGVFALNDQQKAALSQAIEQALKTQLPQQTYCVNSISIANGVMTIKYH